MSDNSQTRTLSGVTRAAVSLACGVALIVTSTGAAAAPDDYVLIRGYTVDEEGMFLLAPGGIRAWEFGPSQVEALTTAACNSPALEAGLEEIEYAFLERGLQIEERRRNNKVLGVEDGVNQNYVDLIDSLWWNEEQENADSFNDFIETRNNLREKCEGEQASPFMRFTIIYASCAMYMQQNGQQMLITLPPSTNGAVMYLRTSSEPPMMLNLNQRFQQAANSVGLDVTMNDASVRLSPSGERGTHLGLATRMYDAQYSATGGTGMLASAGIPAGMGIGAIRVESAGKVAIAADAPGLDVIRAFHRKFASEVRVPAAADAFLNGLVEQMARITELGMPMMQEQAIASGVATPMGNIGQQGYSVQVITGIGILPSGAAPPVVANICNQTLVQNGETAQDLGQMMAGARAADPGTTGQAQSEIQRAMKEAAKAMESMDPAARKMMEQLGIKIPGMPNSD